MKRISSLARLQPCGGPEPTNGRLERPVLHTPGRQLLWTVAETASSGASALVDAGLRPNLVASRRIAREAAVPGDD
jgi:hypothetical protein